MALSNYATVSWSVDDVIENAREVGIRIHKERAKKLLRRRERYIEDAMVEAGWEVIELALRSRRKM